MSGFTGHGVDTLLLLAGESNSGGLGFNSDLPLAELAPTSKVRIWNNDTNTGFDDLDIGTNNLRGHTDLTGVGGIDTTRHGLERVFALRAAHQVHLVKAGQGGSIIGQWAPADASGYYNTLVNRYTLARNRLLATRYEVRPLIVWWQGINDTIAGNTGVGWRNATVTHFNQLRTLTGENTPIFVMKIMSGQASFPGKELINAHIDLLPTLLSNVHPIDVSAANGQVQGDFHHWTAAGLQTCGNALVDQIKARYGSRSGF